MLTTNLEQSQKLKEIGAPQEGIFFYWHFGDTESWLNTTGPKSLMSGCCAAYTLSELIDWLGEDFEHVCNSKAIQDYNEYPTTAGKEWEAVSISNIVAYGKTPLEAVYALAIAVKGEK